jgi:hypothetical protein
MKRLVNLSLALPLVAVLYWPATAQGAVYSFNLDPPNTAADPGTGNVIRVTGAGIFDTATGELVAMGSFKVFASDGTLIARGTWAATDFVDFSSVGGPSPGFQSGVLHTLVTVFPAGGGPITDVPMRVVCNIHPGFDTGLPEGTTIGDFTESTGGLTLFNLHEGP